MARSASLAALALLSQALTRAAGHGYIIEPPARNLVDGSRTGNCPHCGNGKGVCGDGNQWPSGSNYVGAVQSPQRTYTAGSIVRFEVSMNVNHMGHHEFFICDSPISSDSGAVACLQKWPLMRVRPEEVYSDCVPNDLREDCQPVDPNYPGRWYHPPGMAVHRIRYRIPANLQCEHCTLQWFWPTSNSAPYDVASYSCYSKMLAGLGWSFNFCGWACSDSNCPSPFVAPANRAPDPSAGSGFEEFRNCADIRVVGSGGPGTSPTPAPSTTTPLPSPTTKPPTTPMPTPAPTTSTAAASSTAGGGAGDCTPIGDCSGVTWCSYTAYVAWCAEQGRLGSCPSPFCRAGSVAPSPTPAPGTPAPATMTASASSTPSTTSAAPSPPSASVKCIATPGENRGVQDSDCQRCAEGYKWWPCNDAVLCTCTGGGAALVQAPHSSRRLRVDAHRHSTGAGAVAPALIQSGASLVHVANEADAEEL